MKLDKNEFDRGVLSEISKVLNHELKPRQEILRQRFSAELRKAIESSPEVEALLNGKLRFEFGFVAGEEESYVNPMVDFASSRLTVKLHPINFLTGNTKLAFDVIYYDFDIESLLSVQNASYKSKGGPVDWLAWLTLNGDNIVVDTHSIVYGYNQKYAYSRSNLAIMRKSGKGYRVPPEYSGTEDDNFLTRAALSIKTEEIFEEVLHDLR